MHVDRAFANHRYGSMCGVMKNGSALLLGGAGVPNYGDELIVQAWLRWYRERDLLPLKVSGAHTAVFKLEFGVPQGISFSSAIRQVRLATRATDFASAASMGYDFLASKRNDNAPAAREALAASLIHLHGGGYLNSKWPTHGFFLGLAAAAKERTGARIVGTGLGLGPFDGVAPSGAGAVEGVWSAFDAVEVRDHWSFDYLQRVGPEYPVIDGLDDVFVQSAKADRRPGRALHLALQSNDDTVMIVKKLPQAFVDSFDRLYFWICAPVDASAYLEVSKRFPHVEPLNWLQLLDSIPTHERNFMITARFHPHLMGARLGFEGRFRSRSAYYDVKHGSVVALGSGFTDGRVSDLEPDCFEGGNSLASNDATLIRAKASSVSTAIGSGDH